MKEQPLLTFAHQGYPSIRLYEDRFEIKDRDYTEYRSFIFGAVQGLELIDPLDNFWTLWLTRLSYFGRIFGPSEPKTLKVIIDQDRAWEYLTHHEYQPEFYEIIEKIQVKLSMNPPAANKVH